MTGDYNWRSEIVKQCLNRDLNKLFRAPSQKNIRMEGQSFPVVLCEAIPACLWVNF